MYVIEAGPIRVTRNTNNEDNMACTETPYLYRPLAHFGGKILKCAGIATPWSRRIVQGKSAANDDPVYLPGVVEHPRYMGDRIDTETGSVFTGR